MTIGERVTAAILEGMRTWPVVAQLKLGKLTRAEVEGELRMAGGAETDPGRFRGATCDPELGQRRWTVELV